ncbi:hypothetical protein ElyMa_002085600, partial [Elysia marginata]
MRESGKKDKELAQACTSLYGGTCLADVKLCPTGNHATYGQCDGNQACCFGAYDVTTPRQTTSKPAATVQSGNVPQHYLCHDVYGGTCLANLMACPTGNHATYGQCDGGQVCCFGPKPISATAQTTEATTKATTATRPRTTASSGGGGPQHYLCHDVYGGTCLADLMACPTGNHATYGQCDGGKVCCFGYVILAVNTYVMDRSAVS